MIQAETVDGATGAVPPAIPPPKPVAPLTPQQEAYAQLVAKGGQSKQAAYRRAYGKPRATQRRAKDRVDELNWTEAVQARIADLRRKSEAKTILSINDRLGILARDAQVKGNTPALINARARAIDVYTKISGDNAPEPRSPIEGSLTLKGDPSAPLQAVVQRLSPAAAAAGIRAARTARLAAESPVFVPPPMEPALL